MKWNPDMNLDCCTTLGFNDIEDNLIESFCDKFDVSKDDVINTNFHYTYCHRPRKRQMIKKGGEVYHPPFGGWQKISLRCERYSKANFECPICLGHAQDPQKIDCGQVLCKVCLLHALREGRHTCPCCRRTISNFNPLEPDMKWLTGNNNEQWPIAYHGTHGRYVASILYDGLKVRVADDVVHGQEFGPGIYCAPRISTAKHYASDSRINKKNRKVVFFVRVRPNSFDRFELGGHEIWVIRDKIDIRLVAVLLQE